MYSLYHSMQNPATARETHARETQCKPAARFNFDCLEQDFAYALIMFRAMKNTFAGRSPSRRMKYGYHSVPNGM